MDENITTGKKVKRLSARQEKKLSDIEYRRYLKLLRLQDDAGKLSNMPLTKRMRYNRFLRFIMNLSIWLSGVKVYSMNINVPEIPKGRSAIFVLTHCGKYDISVFSKYIQHHYTILSGDYESMHNKVEGFICSLNGQIYFDMQSKEERQ